MDMLCTQEIYMAFVGNIYELSKVYTAMQGHTWFQQIRSKARLRCCRLFHNAIIDLCGWHVMAAKKRVCTTCE